MAKIGCIMSRTTRTTVRGNFTRCGEAASKAARAAVVVSLERMLAIEPRIEELADLPLGWRAWRDSENAPWERAPKQAF